MTTEIKPTKLALLPLKKDVSYDTFRNKLEHIDFIMPDFPPLAYGILGTLLEANCSAKIEKLNVNLDQLEAFHNSDQTEIISDDLREAYNYVPALQYCLDSMSSDKGKPLSTNLICEAHRLLFMGSSRGSSSHAGNIRRSQNYIGNGVDVIYMPPAPGDLDELMSNLTYGFFAYCDNPYVQAAILHAQFEQIHPFIDGNGRIGRLIIIAFLRNLNLIRGPGFYLSQWFYKRQDSYYGYLNDISRGGDWEPWINFFLDGIIDTCKDAKERFAKKGA